MVTGMKDIILAMACALLVLEPNAQYVIATN
jgi:hypothetical protein